MPLDAIKHFRQLHSKCPGHPEYRLTSGVETTTGPLGQGVANSVGMAIAERWEAAHANAPGFADIIDFNVYAICGDGDMMEGISSEAASLAGHWKLSNLCWIYDNNHISIEGSTRLAFTEDVGARFLAYGWHVVHVNDANDVEAFARAIDEFHATTDRPTMIIVTSDIGYGAPHKAGTKEAHGEPLGAAEVAAAKKFYGWPEDAQFLVPDGVYDHFKAGIGTRGKALRDAWNAKFAKYREAYPDRAEILSRIQHRQLPDGWDKDLPVFPADPKGTATRAPAVKSSTSSPRTSPGSSAARPTSPRPPRRT